MKKIHQEGEFVLRDEKNLKKLKNTGHDFKIGFIDPNGGKTKKKSMKVSRTINDIGESPRGD